MCNSPYCQPYSSCNVGSENLVLDHLIIPLLIFLFTHINILDSFQLKDPCSGQTKHRVVLLSKTVYLLSAFFQNCGWELLKD